MSSAVRPKDKPLSAKLISCPWPHLIVDNFLPESVLAKSIAEINSDPHSFDFGKRGSGRIEYSLLKSKTLWTALYSRKTINLLSAAFEVQVTLSRENWIQRSSSFRAVRVKYKLTDHATLSTHFDADSGVQRHARL